MTKTIFQNWKVIAGLSMVAVLLGGAFSFGLFTPKAEATVHLFPFPILCPPETVEHWDKIIFQILRDPSGIVAPSNLKTPLDIKVLDDPDSVANIDSKIRQFIKDHSLFQEALYLKTK